VLAEQQDWSSESLAAIYFAGALVASAARLSDSACDSDIRLLS